MATTASARTVAANTSERSGGAIVLATIAGTRDAGGGLLWLDQPSGFDAEEVEALLEAPPGGLIAAARRAEWNRWIRAEHVARRAALAGLDWAIKKNGRGWCPAGDVHERLAEALESLRQLELRDARLPSTSLRQPYPRSALAFQRALDAAAGRRLMLIGGEATYGFVAAYGAGHELRGPSLMDVLLA